MLNVLIVDDENFVVKSLLTTIDWTSLNLKVTKTFSNGLDALDFIQSHPVDIVITDIRMPGFTGLDLCSTIHQQFPHIQLILISGYADFAYAQKALKYNVLGYCVKPLDFDELQLLLRKAIANIASSHTSEEDLIDCIENEDYTTLSTYLSEQYFNPSSFYIVLSIGSEPLSSYIHCHKLTLKLGVNKYLYILTSPIDKHLLLTPSLNIKGIGVYPYAISITELKSALYHTLEMSYQFFFEQPPYLCDILRESINPPTLSKLQAALVDNNLGSVNLVLSEILEHSKTKNYSISFALKICNLLNTYYIIHYHLEKDDLYIYSFDQLVQKYENFSHMLTALYQMLCEELTIEDLSNTYNNNFIHIIRYINQHYCDDITIRDVSEHLNLSPNYISQLFKKETGSTYTKYLTHLRIEKAKILLLHNHLSINDVCEQVGYNDYFYFLKIFKKHVGLSPGKYKSQLGIS